MRLSLFLSLLCSSEALLEGCEKQAVQKAVRTCALYCTRKFLTVDGCEVIEGKFLSHEIVLIFSRCERRIANGSVKNGENSLLRNGISRRDRQVFYLSKNKKNALKRDNILKFTTRSFFLFNRPIVLKEEDRKSIVCYVLIREKSPIHNCSSFTYL